MGSCYRSCIDPNVYIIIYRMNLILASTLAGLAFAGDVEPPTSDITATCNADNTITVIINHDIDAKVLSASYGSCNLTSTGISGFDTDNVKTWTGTLEPSRCGMEGNLRNLKYNQTAEFTVGRSAAGKDLVFSTYNVDTYCEYTAFYTVTFDYGSISAESHKFDGTGGLIGLNFYVQSTNEHFNETKTSSSQAGEAIYLKLALNDTANKNFDYAENVLASSGKAFVPTKCFVTDSNGSNFTLFDTIENDCSNDVIDLVVSYDNDAHSWNIKHTLFLLDSQDSSDYTLTCEIMVCDMSAGNACKSAYDCLIPSGVEEPTCQDPAEWLWVGQAGYNCQKVYEEEVAYIKAVEGAEKLHLICGKFYLGGYNVYKDNKLGAWRDNCCYENYEHTKACASQWEAQFEV